MLQTASIAAIAELDRIQQAATWNTSSRPYGADPQPPQRDVGRLGRNDGGETPTEEYRRLRLATLATERDEVVKIRSAGTVDHEVIEQVLASLDVEESTLTIVGARADQLTPIEQPVATPNTQAGLCDHLAAAPAEIAPRGLPVQRGLHPRGYEDCAPADLPELRQCRLLRLVRRQACPPALPDDAAPRDAQLRAR